MQTHMTTLPPDDPQKLDDILKNTSLSSIIAKAKLIELLNMALTRHLPSKLLTHCQIMNYDNSIVIMGIDNAAWVTQLRYNEQALIKYFQSEPGLPNVLGIKYKIR